MIVVDTNVMVRLVIGGDEGEDATLLLRQDPEWAAPAILLSELQNVLIGYVRRSDITADQAKVMYDDATAVLDYRIVSVPSPQVIYVALECDLTAYDAEFVALARILNVPLATLDSAILRGAPDVAVSPQELVAR